MARLTARKAVQVLANEGLVEVVQGRGASVTERGEPWRISGAHQYLNRPSHADDDGAAYADRGGNQGGIQAGSVRPGMQSGRAGFVFLACGGPGEPVVAASWAAGPLFAVVIHRLGRAGGQR
jgi:hypothetical protein